MARFLTTGRAFERTLRAPFSSTELGRRSDGPNLDAIGRNAKPRQYFFDRLLQIEVEHDYYNSSDNRCPDLEFAPTPETARLLAGLGLLFKAHATGFMILYNRSTKQQLFNYLERSGSNMDPYESPPSPPEFWSRMSFFVYSTNPYFLNFTDFPNRFNPTLRNFFFVNLQAHREEEKNVLNPGPFVSATNPEQHRPPIIPVQVPVPVTPNTKSVVVRDLAGEEVLCQPACVPLGLIAEGGGERTTCEDVAKWQREHPNGLETCTDKVYLDFALLPEDKYFIELVEDPPSSPPTEVEVLYSDFYPTTLAFVDLLFSRPCPGEPGIFPVHGLRQQLESPMQEPTIESVDYQLVFRRRSTWWNYFIVPQVQDEVLEDLRIVQDGNDAWCDLDHQVDFAGPCCVVLANGQKAFRFLSKEPIPLQEKSTYCFQLRARRPGGHEEILVQRLPVAPIQQLLPQTLATACSNFRDSECTESISEACQEITDLLCREAMADSGVEGSGRSPPQPRLYSFSDIFVYV